MLVGGSLLILATGCSSGGGGGGAVSAQMQALNKSSTAMASLGADAGSLLLSSTRAQATDAVCEADGSPKASGDTTEWAFQKFLCAGAHNTYAPDSALGALALNKGIICTAELNGLTYSDSGTSLTFNNVPLTTACFSAAMLANFTNDSISTVSGTITGYSLDASTSGWDYRINLQGDPNIDDFDLYIRNSGNVIAAAFLSANEGWSVTVDQRAVPNALVFEFGSAERHLRMMAEGTIDAFGNVTSVSNMAGIIAQTDNNEYVSLRGNEVDGILVKWEKSGGGNNDAGTCIDFTATNCVDVTALNFDSGNVANFINNTALTNSAALIDDNPIHMTVSGFDESTNPTTSYDSDLR